MVYTNGNVSATAAPQVITGASLVHRKLTPQQRAVLVADVLDGHARYVPTQKELAGSFGVSVAYVIAARGLSPSTRKAVLDGYDSYSLIDLLNGHKCRREALPIPQTIDDAMLTNMIRIVGVERTLAAAIAVEHA